MTPQSVCPNLFVSCHLCQDGSGGGGGGGSGGGCTCERMLLGSSQVRLFVHSFIRLSVMLLA